MNEVAKVFLATNSDYKYTDVSTRPVVMATVGGFQRSQGIETSPSASRKSLVQKPNEDVVASFHNPIDSASV